MAMAQIDIKTFILLCLIALLPLLFIANQSLRDDKVSSTLDISLNSSSAWTQLRLEGATITSLEVGDPSPGIKHSGDAILMEGPGKARIKAIISVTQNPVRLFLTKDLMGQASIDIGGIGRIENFNQPVSIPISLRTNSTQAKISFNGLSIKKSSIEDLKGPAYRPIITEGSISVANPLGRELKLDLLARASVYDEFPTVVLQKGDNGTFQAEVGNWVYNNNKTGKRTVRNLPVTVEMTTNMTQIFFKGADISQGKITQIDDQGLQASIIGDDFLFLKYNLDGNTFRRATFLMDLNYSQRSGLTIYKNDSGFVGAKIANKNYFLANSSKTDSYVSSSFALGELKDDETALKRISVPLYIETTSDWTDITLEGLDGAEIDVTKVEGNVSQPVVSGDKISIRKNTKGDTNVARVEVAIKAEGQDDGWMEIEKGGSGYTQVRVGQIATFNNMGESKDNAKNRMLFRLPTLPRAEVDPNFIYNPVAYILPIYAELYDQGLTIEETQPKEVSLSINAEEIPEKGFRFSVPVAEGVRIYILIAFLILLVFSAALLRLDARLGLSDTPCRDKVWSQMEVLAKLPFSSALIIESLLAMAIISPLLIDAGSTAIWATSIIYLVTIIAVLLRLAGIKRESSEAEEWTMAKKETFAILLAAAMYIIIFQLLVARPAIGPNISRLLLLATIAILCLLYLFLVHRSRRTYRENFWRMAVSNLENMPISSIIILDALIYLAITPFLLLSIEAMANGAAILAYLLLVAGVAIRFVEMKNLLNIDKRKEVLIKVLCLAMLPAAGILGAFELMKINAGAGQIFFALMIMATAALLAFLFLYLKKANTSQLENRM